MLRCECTADMGIGTEKGDVHGTGSGRLRGDGDQVG